MFDDFSSGAFAGGYDYHANGYDYNNASSYTADTHDFSHLFSDPALVAPDTLEHVPVVVHMEHQPVTWDVTSPLAGDAFARADMITQHIQMLREQLHYTGEEVAGGWYRPTSDEWDGMTFKERGIYHQAYAAHRFSLCDYDDDCDENGPLVAPYDPLAD